MHTPIPNRFIAWTKAFFKGGRPRRKRGMVWWQQPVTLMPMGKSGTREPSHWKVRSPLIVPMQYKFSDIFFYLRGTYVKYPGGWLQLKAFCCWLKGVLHTFITAIYEQKVFLNSNHPPSTFRDSNAPCSPQPTVLRIYSVPFARAFCDML